MSLTYAPGTVTVPVSRRPTAEPRELRPLRLRLRTATPIADPRSLVDGAWWPYGDDLVAEVEPLLAELARRGHVVHRISYCLTAWRSAPRKVHLGGTLARLGGYRTQSPSVIHLIDSSGRAPLVLVVLPPGTPADVAEKALDLAVGVTPLDPAAVLGAARA